MKKSLLALTLLAAAPFAASAAEGVSYNYVEGGYTAANLDGPDTDGWALKGSVAVHPNFHVFADYSAQEVDDVNVDFDQWRVGLGYNHELSKRVDLLTRVAYEKAKTDPEPLPETLDGLAERPEAKNLVAIYAALAGLTREQVIAQFAGQGFGAFKPALADLAVESLAPVTAEMRRLMDDPAEIDRVLKDGAERASAIAEPVVAETKKIVGFWRA